MSSFWLLLAGLALSWGIAAMSVTWLAGDAGLLSLGHSGFLAAGAYIFVLTVNAGAPWPVAMLVACLSTGLLGWAIGWMAGPARGALFSLLTLGFGLAVPRLALLLSPWTGGSRGLAVRALTWPATDLARLAVAVAIAASLYVVAARWQRGWLGAAWRLQRDRPDVATTYGLSPPQLRRTAVALSAACTGVAGALLALQTQLVSPYDYGLATAFQLVVAAAAGRIGSLVGAFAAAAGLTVLPFAASTVISGLRPEWIVIGQGLLLVVALSVAGRLPGVGRGRGTGRGVRAGRSADDPNGPSPVAVHAEDASPPLPDRAGLPEGWVEKAGLPPGWAEQAGVQGQPGELTVTGLATSRSGFRLGPVDFALSPGTVSVLRGGNGVGKSTLLAALSGHVPARGTRRLNGAEVTDSTPSAIARRGLVHQWQGIGLAPSLTVAEHLALAGLAHWPLWRAAVPGLTWRRWANELAAVAAWAGPTAGLAQQPVWSLSGGQAAFVQLLASARLRPAVLLLDEPFAGMGNMYRPWVAALLSKLQADGTAVLAVEHRSGWITGATEWRLAGGLLHTGAELPKAAGIDRGVTVRPWAPSRVATGASRVPLLTIDNLRFGHGDGPELWPPVSLQLRPHTVIGLTGPNGSGKSTFLRVLAGQLPAWGGTVTGHGDVLPNGITERLQRGIVLVPQHNNVFADLTVAEQLQLAAAGGHRARGNAQAGLARVFELLPPLADWLHRRGGKLSGGERQLLALGRAVAMAPRVLLLDEPTAGLDRAGQRLVAEAIAALQADGAAMLVAEQNEPWLQEVAGELLTMTAAGLVPAHDKMTGEVER